MTNDTDKFYKYYARIVQYCVDNSTNYFPSKWFHAMCEEPHPYDYLHSMRTASLLTYDKTANVYYVAQLYSHLRWIGKLCAEYAGNPAGRIDPKTEILSAITETKLSPEITEFLCITTDYTVEQKANVLEMTKKEVQALEDYFFLRLGFIVVRRRVKLPFSDAIIAENPNYFTSKVEKFDSTGVSQ